MNEGSIVEVNQGTAKKFVSQAPVISVYQSEAHVDATTAIHLYHCAPLPLPIGVKVLERHRYTTQAFLPMTPTQAGNEGYLVVVALNGQGERQEPVSFSICAFADRFIMQMTSLIYRLSPLSMLLIHKAFLITLVSGTTP